MKPEKDRYNWTRQVGLLTALPFLMAGPPIAGLLIGRFLDKRFSTNPVLTIIFLLLGFAAGVREVVNVMRKANAPSERDKSGPGAG